MIPSQFFFAESNQAGLGLVLYCKDEVSVNRIVKGIGSAAVFNAHMEARGLPDECIMPGDLVLKVNNHPLAYSISSTPLSVIFQWFPLN